jgi:hypothetical protein
MAQAGTQKTKNVCSHCGKAFDSPDALHEHEAKCKSAGASTGNPVNAAAEPPKRTPEEIENDMRIEEAFEAEDN